MTTDTDKVPCALPRPGAHGKSLGHQARRLVHGGRSSARVDVCLGPCCLAVRRAYGAVVGPVSFLRQPRFVAFWAPQVDYFLRVSAAAAFCVCWLVCFLLLLLLCCCCCCTFCDDFCPASFTFVVAAAAVPCLVGVSLSLFALAVKYGSAMVNIHGRRCHHEDCDKQPTFGHKGAKVSLRLSPSGSQDAYLILCWLEAEERSTSRTKSQLKISSGSDFQAHSKAGRERAEGRLGFCVVG